MVFKRAAVTVGILICVLSACTIAAAVAIAEGALHPLRRPLPRTTPIVPTAHTSSVLIDGADGARLGAWLFTPLHANGFGVLALHGIADNRASMTAMASVLTRHGYTVLAPDARGHGESGGLATYGVRETDDVRRWISLLREHVQGCVYGFGESLGGALLLQSLGSAGGLCAVVAESPFASFPGVAADRIRLHLGGLPDAAASFVARMMVRVGLLYARLRYDADLRTARPDQAVGRTHVPILLIHGTDDVLAPPSYGETLRARNPAAISVWLVPSANHTQAWAAVGDDFPARVLDFFAAHREW